MAAYESSGVQGRLTTPLVRVDGVLRPTTWDVALDTVARGLARAKAAHGPDAVGMFACSKTTNELNYAAQKLMRGVDRHEQHRQLQPDLTRPFGRRAGGRVRCRGRHLVLRGAGADGRARALGLERPRDASDHVPAHAQGAAERRPPGGRRPPPDRERPLGERARRPPRGLGHRPRQRHRARRHRGGPPARLVHRQQHARLRGAPQVGRTHHAGVGGARDRRARRADPADRPPLRDGRPGHHLLDARDHRAPQRGRQRPRAHQPGPPHRPRRPARLRAQSPPGPEQRPGRRRHGRGAAASCPASRTSSTPRSGAPSRSAGACASRRPGA